MSLPVRESALRLLLLDDRTVIREGLCLLVEQQPDIRVVGQAGTLREAVALDVAPPQVVMTEFGLPDGSGADVIIALRRRFPTAGVLVLTAIDQPAKVQQAVSSGAAGYVLTSAQPADVLTAIRAVAQGETYVQPSLGVALVRWRGADGSGGDRARSGLSGREQDVLRLVALGHTNAEIAERTGVSLRTVETHRAHIMRKLTCRTRAELVRYAREVGLVDFEVD